MPLINCTECGKQVSLEAQACPNCGHPVARMQASLPVKTMKCPYCRKDVASNAETCPHCHMRIAQFTSSQRSPSRGKTPQQPLPPPQATTGLAALSGPRWGDVEVVPPPSPVPRAPVPPRQTNTIPEEPKPALKTSKLANWVSFFIAVVIMTVIWALTDYRLPWWLGFIAVLIIQGVLLATWNQTKKKK